MTLTDEELDALAERLIHVWIHAHGDQNAEWRAAAREAARWAAEQQGEVVWERKNPINNGWYSVDDEKEAQARERNGYPVRAIRVIATTTKGQTNE